MVKMTYIYIRKKMRNSNKKTFNNIYGKTDVILEHIANIHNNVDDRLELENLGIELNE